MTMISIVTGASAGPLTFSRERDNDDDEDDDDEDDEDDDDSDDDDDDGAVYCHNILNRSRESPLPD
ncbi:hypothetical protein K0M31_007568 [Melipona bicolor]|uniref:Uncharacterized protein n=1 Tax=Melipona bicolor TaxID=60889 RepID=A0AA40GBM8_9HYME|nr:hypothetical protein K0M31_007568 [Melipona bicolor]